jgi:hypothetical protein
MLVHEFVKTDSTHLLFVAGDMVFEPDLCERLLKSGKPVVGTIYARRALDFAKLKHAVSTHGFDHGLALAHDWNVRFPGPRLEVQNGLCRVEGMGFGFALIERSALVTLAEDYPTYLAPNGKDTLRAFFREMEPRTRQGARPRLLVLQALDRAGREGVGIRERAHSAR